MQIVRNSCTMYNNVKHVRMTNAEINLLNKINLLPNITESHTIDALIFSVLINASIIFKPTKIVKMFPCRCHNPLRAISNEICQQ